MVYVVGKVTLGQVFLQVLQSLVVEPNILNIRKGIFTNPTEAAEKLNSYSTSHVEELVNKRIMYETVIIHNTKSITVQIPFSFIQELKKCKVSLRT